MDSKPTPTGPFAVLYEQLQAWERDIAHHRACIADIEGKVAKLMAGAGIDQSAIKRALSAPPEPKVDARREGAMIATAIGLIAASPNGLSRIELKARLLEHPEHGIRIKRNENGFYGMVKRGLARDELVERGKRLYLPGQPVGEEAGAGPPDLPSSYNAEPRPPSWRRSQLQPGGLPYMIRQVLDGHPEGLGTPDIGDLVAGLPGGEERLGVGRANLNPTMSKLCRAEHIIRFGKGYYRLPKYPEPPAKIDVDALMGDLLSHPVTKPM